MLFPIFPFLYYVYEIFSHSRNLIPIYPRSPSPHSIVVLLLVLYHTCYALEPLTQTPRELSHVVKRLCNSSSTHAVTQHWWRKCTCVRAELLDVPCVLRLLSKLFSIFPCRIGRIPYCRPIMPFVFLLFFYFLMLVRTHLILYSQQLHTECICNATIQTKQYQIVESNGNFDACNTIMIEI